MRILNLSVQGSSALLSLLLLALTGPMGISNSVSAAEVGDPTRIVNILQEPRHRLMHQDGDIRVLDVQINPGDMTLQHTHNAAIMYAFISSGEGPSGGRVTSNTDYVTENFTHQVSNEGPGLFRIIALTNYGPPMAELTSDRPTGIEGEPQLENLWFRSYRITLAPGESTAMQMHHNPSIVVQVTDGMTHVTREDGITAELTAMGGWAWRNAHSTYQVRNIGTTPVEFVIQEARRAM
ncbi:MAG: hypothetical protein Q7V56_12275 [Gammaproteobacteria bacterium]|nr:hypothetical protein [Gammaproteobacteria bacterium]